MKRTMIIMLLLAIAIFANCQNYYNLRYTWQEIESAVATVKDSLNVKLEGKLDANVSHIAVEQNSGVSKVFDLPISDAPQNSEHGYYFGIGGVPVIRLSIMTADGNAIEKQMVAIGSALPDDEYLLTVAGAAIADRWDVAGADFAEYFMNNGVPIPLGTSVVFDAAGCIRPAIYGERPFGITSAGAGFVGNTGRQGQKFMTNALGDTIKVSKQYVLVERETKFPEKLGIKSVWVPVENMDKLPENAQYETRETPIKNPDYDMPYTPRKNDPNYQLVGLIGQIPLRKGQPVSPSWYFIKNLDKDTDLWLVK